MLPLLLSALIPGSAYINEVPVGAVDVAAIEIHVFERPVRVSYDIVVFADGMETP